MDASKKKFLQQVQQVAMILANVDHQIEDIDQVWNARFYGPGAANEFTDTEMQEIRAGGGFACSPDELYAFVILCSQMINFFHNGTVVQSDYCATVQKVRTDI